ncbi:MAG: lipopolysaccharide transport periplasmic protein LptA [Aliivibrio sp.]|uniref:lipopolysaccharide transport periplasmic protein LptA n=1 Tax=Aliivibrio sp. TaxID=1872443 RepID=UPI001A51D1A7|nr:lipopolysaccharide transport periplasmic protein LptA [Aliivibrio sp.]
MKLQKISLIVCLCLTSLSSWALSTDTDQPIYIDSDTQNFDMKSNRVTFTGDVTLKQGSINIWADKLIVIRPNGSEGREILEAYGKPARFSQLTDDGKTLKGHALKLRYEIEKDFLLMTREAQISQDDSTIQGDVITYHIGTQKLVANSSETKRVTTVLQPSQLNKKE